MMVRMSGHTKTYVKKGGTAGAETLVPGIFGFGTRVFFYSSVRKEKSKGEE